MEFIKLKENGTYDFAVSAYASTEWDETHFCTPQALTPEEALMFRVVELHPTPMLEFNSETETCQLQDPEFVEGIWVQKWQVTELNFLELQAKLESMKSNALSQFPADVDAILAARIGQRLGEYMRAEADARAYLEACALDANCPVPRKVLGHATANGLACQTAAMDILTQATELILVEDNLRDTRLLRQAQVRNVVLGESRAREEVIAAIESVKTIVENWNGFIAYLRTQLGI